MLESLVLFCLMVVIDMGRDAISAEKLKKWHAQMLEQCDRRLDGAVTVEVWSQSLMPPYDWTKVSVQQIYTYLARMADAGFVRKFKGKTSKPQLWEVLPESGIWRDRSGSDVVLADKELGVEYIRLPWQKYEHEVKLFRCVDAAAGRLESKLMRFADDDFGQDARGYWISFARRFVPDGEIFKIPPAQIDEEVAELVEADLDRLRRGVVVHWQMNIDLDDRTHYVDLFKDLDFMKNASMEEIIEANR